jgi:hypothetical protein
MTAGRIATRAHSATRSGAHEGRRRTPASPRRFLEPCHASELYLIVTTIRASEAPAAACPRIRRAFLDGLRGPERSQPIAAYCILLNFYCRLYIYMSYGGSGGATANEGQEASTATLRRQVRSVERPLSSHADYWILAAGLGLESAPHRQFGLRSHARIKCARKRRRLVFASAGRY